MYQLVGGHYQRMAPNERGHYPTPDGSRISLGGSLSEPDSTLAALVGLQGNLLLTGTERGW